MGEEVFPRPLEDWDIAAAPFWTMSLLEWSPEASKSGVALLIQDVPPQPPALPLARVHEVRGLVA
jgi:hypothetical protein